MQRRKRAHIDIQVYEDWELGASSSTPSQPPLTESTTHRHVDYVAHKRGISTKTSYYSTEALSTVITDDHEHDESSTYDSVYDETMGFIGLSTTQRTMRRLLASQGLLANARWQGSSLPVFLYDRRLTSRSLGSTVEFLRLEGRAYPDAGAPAFTQSLPVEKTAFPVFPMFRPLIVLPGLHSVAAPGSPTHVVESTILGLQFQLGHPIGEPCLNPKPANKDKPLFQHHNRPSNCSHLRCPAPFPVTHVGSKIWVYISLMQIMDRYTAFMRIVRQWRHIRLLKHAGHGHERVCRTAVSSLISRSVSLLTTNRWIYSLFLAIDANFHSKAWHVQQHCDPGLNKGYTYFVEEKKFKEFLESFEGAPPDEASTCNNYDAVKLASIRGGRALLLVGLAPSSAVATT
ncbi:CxC2 domain-containing protein [Salix suchowensis]|nr:CxC2 domain-containing protein [Salix suchowensis]